MPRFDYQISDEDYDDDYAIEKFWADFFNQDFKFFSKLNDFTRNIPWWSSASEKIQ